MDGKKVILAIIIITLIGIALTWFLLHVIPNNMEAFAYIDQLDIERTDLVKNYFISYKN